MNDSVYLPIPIQNSEALPHCPIPQDCGEPLVRVDSALPRVAFAGSYFALGLPGSPQVCLVRAGLVPLLERALSLLSQEESLLVFDAYRPLSVQQALYEQYAAQLRAEFPGIGEAELAAKLDDFVALPVPNPARPAPHATGGALDLTLCRCGTPLPMGTEFDDFSPKAATAYYEQAAHCVGPEAAAFRENRRRLYWVMTQAGFVNYSAEWWHFSCGDRLWARTFQQTPRYGLCAEPCQSPQAAVAIVG